MKQLTIFIALSILVGCGSGGSSDTKSELDSYRQKVKEYNQKIAELEAELDSESKDSIEISLLPVEVKQISHQIFTRYFEVNGSVEAVEDAFISPEINGQIQSVFVERGARISKGDLLVKLKTDVTEKSIDEIKTSLKLAERIFEKQEDLWEQNIGSEIQYLEASNAKESLEARLATLEKQLELAQIRAPFSGIVDDIMVEVGELASPGMPFIHLVNLSNIRVSARVSEAYLTSVIKGDQVEVRFASYPDMKLRTVVTRLGEVIDQKTRTFILEVELKNPGEKLKPNMLSSLRINDFEEKHALVVPSIILKQDFNGTFLFLANVKDESSTARKVYVEKGITVQDQTLVTDGLSVGDLVILKGYNLVGEGSQVRIINQ
jgi:membrane fusion protein (multidrug efflux system)